MDVLQHHHQRAALAGLFPQPSDGFEQLEPYGLGGRGRHAEVRHERTERRGARSRPLQHLVGTVLADQLTQGAGHRRVRQPVAAERYALAADELGPTVAERPEQVGGEGLDHGGLACAGVAADDDEAAAGVDHVVEHAAELSALARAADHLLRPITAGRPEHAHHVDHRAIES